MLEKIIERSLYASRWLLAPIYLGLSLALLLIAIKFFQELLHLFPLILEVTEADLVVTILSLIDMALVGGLMVMVMLGGYESFVSRLDIKTDNDLAWLGKLDVGSIKLKLATSIVAVSSIHLLQKFVNAEHVDNQKLFWYVMIHLAFVVSAIGMAWMDRIAKKD